MRHFGVFFMMMLCSVNIWSTAVCCCMQPAGPGPAEPSCHQTTQAVAATPSCHAAAETSDGEYVAKRSCDCADHDQVRRPLAMSSAETETSHFVVSPNPFPSVQENRLSTVFRTVLLASPAEVLPDVRAPSGAVLCRFLI